MKGEFYTLQIHHAKKIEEKDGLKIFGVQIKKFLPEGFVHWDGMTPPKTLLFQMKDLEKKGQYDEEVFKEVYTPAFIKNLKGNKKAELEMKEIIETLKKGEDVYYACYCKNPDTCHRSIIEKMIQKKGYTTKRI